MSRILFHPVHQAWAFGLRIYLQCDVETICIRVERACVDTDLIFCIFCWGAFGYADYIPDFAAPVTDASPEEKLAEIQSALCRQAFDACLQGLIPKLYAARALDHNLLRPFRYCHRIWRDGAAAFRHELIVLSTRWNELGLAGSYPYILPTSTELLEH